MSVMKLGVLALAMLILAAGQSQGAVITYSGQLFDDAPHVPGPPGFGDSVPNTGSVSSSGNFDSAESSLSNYWTFFGNAGDTVTITVQRSEVAFDPFLWIFEGTFADDAVFGGSVDFGDPGWLAFGDDELDDPGPWEDPQVIVELTLPGTGQYTAIVTNFASDPDDGDGLFPYEIYADGVTAVAAVPEPTTLTLWGLGALGCAFVAHRRRRR
jgi:hypothetical protein